MVANPVSELVLIKLFIQGLADGTFRDHLFRGELKTLSEAIYAAEKEGFSVRQAHTTLTHYRPQRRPVVGGREPTDLCHVEGGMHHPANNKRLLRCHCCHKLGHCAYECSVPSQNLAGLSAVTFHKPGEQEDEGPTLSQCRNREAD